MSEPTKPFFKPFSQTPPPAASERTPVTKGELTIYAVAAGMHPADRAAFLAHACAGNDALRLKIEQQIAARAPLPAAAVPPAPVPAPPAVAAPVPTAPTSAPAPVSPAPVAAAPITAPLPEATPPAAAPAPSGTTVPSAEAPAPATVHAAELHRIAEPHPALSPNQPAGMALVPMSASQLAAITAQRTNTFPWLTAVFLGVAAGSLAVFLMQEKEARHRAETAQHQAGQRADTAAKEAAEARAAVGQERETAATQLAAARKDAEKLRATAEEQRQLAEAATQQATAAKAEADRQRAALEAAKKDAIAAGTAATAATAAANAAAAPDKATLAKAEQERDAMRTTQKETVLAFADTLAKLAAAQIEGARFAEAETSARRSLELRTTQSVTGWPLVESRVLLGAALLQKNADAEAEREFTAATADIEQLGAPLADADRARLAIASRRIVQFYTATSRRKEAAELKRKFDALARLAPAESRP